MVSEEVNSKKQRNEKCFINCLPRDLIERVFLRLPVSTLLICVGVCKPWQSLIRDPQFVTLHLKNASHFALLFFGQESVADKHYPSDAILIDEAWSQSRYALPAVEPDDIIFGSCNGLLGLYTNTSSIKIANLATGECLRLKKPVKNMRDDHFSCYNFGFHPLTKEYKITHFLADDVEGHPQNKDRFNVIQVYMLGDEKWKDIRTPEALNLNCVRNSGTISVGGTMYWLTEDMAARWQHAVISFDFSEESFERIRLPASVPEDCAYGGPRQYWVRELDGKICIASAQTSRDRPCELFGKLQIWTLDNNVEQRWSQKYNIHLLDYIPAPNLAHLDMLLTQHSASQEVLGNGENFVNKLLKMEKLLDFSPRKPDNMQSYICVKSLVRLNVYKKVGIVCRPNKRGGWQLKKWKAWENELSKSEELWSRIHQMEHEKTASSQKWSVRFNGLLPHISDDVIRQQIGMKMDQIFPVFPDQPSRSLRRLNLVGRKQDIENVCARVKKLKEITEASTDAVESILSMLESFFRRNGITMIESAIPDQAGTSSSDAITANQKQSPGYD